MEIIWIADTNIFYGSLIPSDRLHLVSKCLYDNLYPTLIPSVAAEIRSGYDERIARIISSG